MTLVLLAIVATILAGLARRVSDQSVTVALAQQDLQRRWGAATATRTLLPQAEAALTQVELQLRHPQRSVEHRIGLGDQTFVVVLTDEQAKPNVNVLATGRDPRAVETAARRLSPPQLDPLIELTPLRDGTSPTLQSGASMRFAGGTADTRRMPASSRAAARSAAPNPSEAEGNVNNLTDSAKVFLMMGQVYRDLAWVEEAGSWRPIDLPLTCWGDGRLNLRRVEEDALTSLLPGVISPDIARALLEARDRYPDDTLDELLSRQGLTRRQLEALKPRLRDGSGCYGIWVLATPGSRSGSGSSSVFGSAASPPDVWFAVLSETASDEPLDPDRIRRYLW